MLPKRDQRLLNGVGRGFIVPQNPTRRCTNRGNVRANLFFKLSVIDMPGGLPRERDPISLVFFCNTYCSHRTEASRHPDPSNGQPYGGSGRHPVSKDRLQRSAQGWGALGFGFELGRSRQQPVRKRHLRLKGLDTDHRVDEARSNRSTTTGKHLAKIARCGGVRLVGRSVAGLRVIQTHRILLVQVVEAVSERGSRATERKPAPEQRGAIGQGFFRLRSSWPVSPSSLMGSCHSRGVASPWVVAAEMRSEPE